MRHRHVFRSMGCDIVVVGSASGPRLREIELLFERRDRMFSRFRPESELNRVNAGAGTVVPVSAEFGEMLAVALEARHETGGLVDPTLGAELEAAGYDRDFPALEQGAEQPRGPAAARDRAIHLDRGSVALSEGLRLDLNGVVKGKTVDDALELLEGDGLVSAGGDLAVRGTHVAALPRGGSVSLVRGALATSGVDRRRWVRDGQEQHHLIDPRTGAPAASPWEQVTVCALSCLGADVAAKGAFLLGPAGPGWLDARGLPGRFVGRTGGLLVNEAWRRGLEEAACT